MKDNSLQIDLATRDLQNFYHRHQQLQLEQSQQVKFSNKSRVLTERILVMEMKMSQKRQLIQNLLGSKPI